MSSLPLISHHLFVAAVGTDEKFPPATSVSDWNGQHPQSPPAVTLQVLEQIHPLPIRMKRTKRVSLQTKD
jgi:hypothetical protein